MNAIKIFALLSFIMFHQGCGRRTKMPQAELTQGTKSFEIIAFTDFFNNLKTLCGWSFPGKQIFMAAGRECWEDKSMVINVSFCEEGAIHIPLHLDEDQSRTMIFLNDEGKLRLRHDHRSADGTPEEITHYGGYADKYRATSLHQVFMADEYTGRLIPGSAGSEWIVALKDEMTILSYQLHQEGKLIFRADFDLRNPL